MRVLEENGRHAGNKDTVYMQAGPGGSGELKTVKTPERPKKSPELKAEEWVEVRSRREILATLDQRGRLDGMPFMPEMFQYCGKRFRVFKRADKTCDPAHLPWSIRRVKD